MLRRVPARIEAENFGQDGALVSYEVKNAKRASAFYRTTEPVTIKAGPTQRPKSSNQFITLTESEWTAYKVSNKAPAQYDITLRVRAESAPAEAQLSINGQLLPLKIADKSWTEVKLGSVMLDRGVTQLKWAVKRGTVDLDWFDIRPGEQPKLGSETKTTTSTGG